MGKNLEKAKVIRNDPDVHYNCAQALLCAFAEDCGLTQEQACSIGANFGNGMKMAGTCGAVTSALMVLGLKGIDDGPTIAAFQRAIRDNHDGCLDCADLLRMNKERGGEGSRTATAWSTRPQNWWKRFWRREEKRPDFV